MFKNFFPNKILLLNNKLINSLLISMILIVFVGLIYALFLSPPDYVQGDSVRIMYVHVPASFIALGCFGFIGIASILNLVFKIKFMPLMAKSLAPVGCLFSIVSIVTGSLWGKPTWGIWWVWDARLTSELVLLFLYLGYMALQSAFSDRRTASRASAILALVGVVNLPIIHYSVDWWNTLHQGATILKANAPSIHPSMLIPLLIMVLAFHLHFFTVALMRIRCEILEDEKQTHWVQKLGTRR